MEMEDYYSNEICIKHLLPIRDALEVINGKWKLHVIASLMQGEKRFKDMLREIRGITAKMLSQELKSLEAHELVTRRTIEGRPVVVLYHLTEYGDSLKKLMDELKDWGQNHRKKLMNNTKEGA